MERCSEPSFLSAIPFFLRSARFSMFCHADYLYYFYHRVRTVLQCVPQVYTDQAACLPAPAIITHPALLLTAPASAGKV